MEWPLLNSLDEPVRRKVLSSAHRRVFRRNEVIFHEGDPGDTLHMVLKGHVAIRVATPLGERVTLTVVGAGEAFGELALLSDDSTRTATAAAVEGAETMTLHRRDFEDLRRSDPSVERLLVEALSTRVARLTGHLVEALYEPVEVRLVRRLVSLCRTYESTDGTITVPLTQEDLASMAGTVAVARGRIEILDVDALQRSAR